MAFVLAQPLFPGANVAMGIRMTKDMTFDARPAIRDFGWNPRAFTRSISRRRYLNP